MSNIPSQPPQGSEIDGMRGNVGGQSQVGNQAESRQASSTQPFQSSPQVVQIPLTAAAIPVPSLQLPIPDSLNTLSEFMNRMERALSQNGYQPNTSSSSNEDVPEAELPFNERGLPTPEALSIVLRHAQRLLSGHAVDALSHIAGRLEQEGASSDPTIRSQIQTESAQIGLAMLHLGSLILELGRVILTLHMGQSPAESSVNAGPGVYISPSGPNPIMVQPSPLQTSSLFGASVPSSNPTNIGTVGIGNTPRHINIHIHAGTTLAPVLSAVGTRSNNGDGVQGERGNNTGSAELAGSGSVQLVPMRNVIAAAVPSRPNGAAISTAVQPGFGFSVSPQPADAGFLSTVLNVASSQIRNFVGNMQGENQVASATGQNLSGGPSAGNDGNERLSSMPVNRVGENSLSSPSAMQEREGLKPVPECDQVRNNEDTGNVLSSKDASSHTGRGSQSSSNVESTGKPEDSSGDALGSSEKQDLQEGAKAVPLGSGLGGLERKRQVRQPKTLLKNDGETSNTPDQNLNSRSFGQLLLRSLTSSSSGMNRTVADDPSSDQTPLVGRVTESTQAGRQRTDSKLDAASAMSQALHSPELNGVLPGFPVQTGIVSPDVLRNMLQQLTQSPQIINTVNQIAQQIDTQDLGNVFSGLGGGRGGGIDLSRMVQQMMPVVSQALGRGSVPQPFSATPQHTEQRSTGMNNPEDQNFQIGIQEMAQRIEHFDRPEEVFRALVQNVGRFHGNGSGPEDFVNELCSDEGLAHEYAEMLRHDICRRLEGDFGRDKC